MRAVLDSDAVAIRLDLIKLVHRHDQTPKDMIVRAAELEKYVAFGQADKAPTKAQREK